MDSLPKRKTNRLTGYDYSRPGCYFVTICAKNRRYLFWDEFDWRVGAACGRPLLSQIGTIVEKEIHRLSQIYSMVCVDKFVVMPNHIHLLIRIRFSESGRPQAAPTLSQIINQFKGSATKRAGYILWQKGYHDHIIRSEADYLRIWDYIDTNPAKWREDCYYCQAEGAVSP